MKYLILLLLLLPSAHALSIAASPSKLEGGATLRLFNPNDVNIEYQLESEAFKKKGVMEKKSYEDVVIDVGEWYGADTINVYYRTADGSSGIELRSGLQIPIENNKIVRVGTPILMFSTAFIITLIIMICLYKIL